MTANCTSDRRIAGPFLIGASLLVLGASAYALAAGEFGDAFGSRTPGGAVSVVEAPSPATSAAGTNLALTALAIPSTPASFTGTVKSASNIDLQWVNASADADRLEIQRRTAAETSWTALGSIPAGQTKFQSIGLLADTQYLHRIRACNASGCSTYANLAGLTTFARRTLPRGAVIIAAAPGKIGRAHV